MIIKNGEILAIDHIAHDNTLSGNGTSAKPVGLSQSTKDLIDNKVKKTDFETYKSSAANQISNINTKITTDESNFESYKETVAANFTAVDERITNVANAKQDKGNYVSATNFNDFKNTVEGQIDALETGKQPVGDYVVTNDFNSYKETVDGKFTTVNERITNVDNAKQNKGDYVSASDFNTYKTDVAGEITRVDGRIDTTNTNLENNYYKKNQTYSQSEVDEIVSKLGAYVYVEDVNEDGSPNVDNPSSKVIYLTQVPNETQCLQWIWLETQEWKCIGDTTMNLSAYATKEWANDNFETIDQFNTIIANYYTKGDVNTELATKVDNDDFNAYKSEVNSKFTDTSAWVNATFATKTDLNNDKSELEGEINNLESKIEQDINNASADIINKIDTASADLDDKIEAVIDTLEDDYYTSEQIDARLAASGEYYTQSQVDKKLEDYAKSTDLDPIKDDINSISAKFDNYYTQDDINNNFVSNTRFNTLNRFVDDIDDDLDIVSGDVVTLSGKVNKLHNTVIESSNTVIATPTTGEDGTVIYELSANGNELWKPTVNADGDISWEKSESTVTPTTVNIKGPKGEDGKTPAFRIDESTNYWEYSYDGTNWISLDISATGPKGIDGTTPTIDIDPNDDTWIINGIDTGIVASGTVGPAGKDGVNGKDGKDGISLSATSQELTNKTQVQIGQVNGQVQTTFDLPWGQDGVSPTVTTNTLSPDEHQAEGHINGGVKVTITDKTGDHEYTAWNGNNGTMAGAPTIMGYDGIAANLNGTQYEVGLSSEYKAAIESISADYAKTTDLNDYLKTSVAETTYQTVNGMSDYYKKTETSGKDDISTALNLKADKTEIPSIAGLASETYVQQASAYAYAAATAQIPTTVAELTDSGDYLLTATYAADSGKFVTCGSEISAANEQYALTTNGWAKIETPATFTGVTTTGSVSGGGVNNDTIGLLTSAENALTAVANKIDKPDTTQTSLNNKYLVYSTLSAEGAVTGWTDFNTNVYSKTESDGRYVATAEVGTGLYYSGSSPKLGVKLGTDLAFDTNGNIQVNTNGIATGEYSFAEGVNTKATVSAAHAEGSNTSACASAAHAEGVNTYVGGRYGHAEGQNSSAYGAAAHAEGYSVASGDGAHSEGINTSAIGYNVHTQGRGTVFNGVTAAGIHDGISIQGSYNATTANPAVHNGALSIWGNGTADNARSDAMLLYRDGTVSANNYKAVGYTDPNNNYVEASIPKSIPNSANNNNVAQRFFICTSDQDIINHAAYSNQEGCVFFRIG